MSETRKIRKNQNLENFWNEKFRKVETECKLEKIEISEEISENKVFKPPHEEVELLLQ